MEAAGLVLFSASFGVAVAPKSGTVSMVNGAGMEGQPLRVTSILKRTSEDCHDKICTGVLGYLVAHDLSEI